MRFLKAISYFGYRCPKCGSTVDIGAIVGSSEILCPSCNTVMEPDKNGRVSAANVYCSSCNSSFGLVNSDKCPNCGGAFSRMK